MRDADERRSLRRIDATLRASAIAAALALMVWLLRDIMLLIFAAVLIACVLRGGSHRLHRETGLGEGWSLLAVIVALAVAIGSMAWWRGPAIADQAANLTDQLVNQVQRGWLHIEDTNLGQRMVDLLRGNGQSAVGEVAGYVPTLASTTLGLAGSTVVVIATALFLASAPDRYVSGTCRLLPTSWRPRGREVLHQIGETLQLWFLGQLLDMLVVTVLIGAGLFALGVPLAPTLALFAGLLNFVPYIGALAGAVPAILVGLAGSPTLALWIGLLFLAVQMLEGNVIAPLIQRHTISLPAAVTILAQTVLGTLFGLLGIILATPLAAASMTAVRMAYVESVLERGGPSEP